MKKFTKIQLRRDTTAALSNIILASGEPAFATDTKALKIGDGVTSWSNLQSSVGGEGLTENQVLTIVNSGISGVIGNAPELLNTLNELSEAINDDENFATTILNAIDNKADLSGIPIFAGINLLNGTTLAQGTYDNSTGGQSGISLNCYVGYELNWQGGHLKSTWDNGNNVANIYCDSPIEFQGAGPDNVQIDSSGITFSDGTTLDTANHNHSSSNVTDFNSAVSGLIQVQDITSGSGVVVTDTNGVYNIATSPTGNFTSLQVNNTDVLVSGDDISLLNNDLLYVPSNPTGIVGATSVNNIVKISQADFDNIVSPDPNTIFFIV